MLFPITREYKREGRTSGWFVNFFKYKRVIINRALIEALKTYDIPFPDSVTEEMEWLIEQLSDNRIS